MADKSLLTPLPASTVRLIGSTQVITSVYSVVKELLENSFDAEATAIDVKLENYGLDKIEIKDNGKGIRTPDVAFVGQRHYTSKITSHNDLQNLHTYGFRGEAIASLCAVSEVSLTTKTSEDEIGVQYKLSNEGLIKDSIPSHLGQGTTICAVNLFKNLPVRKQYHNTNKKKKNEIKKIEDLLRAYSIIKPDVRITLRHNKEMVFQKAVLPDTRAAILNVLGHQIANSLECRKKTCEESGITIEAYLPKPGSDVQVFSRSANDRSFIAANQRPVNLTDIDKLVRQYYCNCHGCESTRYPIYYLSIDVPADKLDVNLDPNKSKVLLQDMDACKNLTTEILEYMYGPLDDPPYWKKQKEQDAVSEQNTADRNEIVQEKLGQFDRNSEKIFLDNHLHKGPNKLNTDLEITDTDVIDVIGDSRMESINNEIDSERRNKIYTKANGSSENCENRLVLNSDMETAMTFNESSKSASTVDPSAVTTSSSAAPQLTNKNTAHSNSEMETSIIPNQQSKKSPNPVSENLPDLTFSDSFDESILKNNVNSQLINRKNNSTCVNDSTSLLSEPSLEIGQFDITDDLLDEILPTQSTSTAEVTNRIPSMNNIKDDDWSRGIGCGGMAGKVIQPVTLLPPGGHHTPGKRPLSPSTSNTSMAPPDKKPRPIMNISIPHGQTTMYDIVGNQPIKRPVTALELYTKDVRPQVVDENPDATYIEISLLVEEQWNNLSADETQKYHHKAASLARKSTKSPKDQPKPFSVIGSKKSNVPVSERLLNLGKKKKKYREGIKIVDVPFSSTKLCNKYKSGFLQTQSQPSETLNIIGCLKSNGSWVCCRGQEIFLANPHRMTEVAIFQRLIKDYKCSTKPLEKPIRLNTSNVGGEENWQKIKYLSDKETSLDQYVGITDNRIVKNGFQIKSYSNKESGEFSAELTEIANYIPTYNIIDFTETLNNINIDTSQSLEQTRPLKVYHYLKSEAVRMMRNKTALTSREEMEDLISTLSQSAPLEKLTCLHDKDVIYPVYNMTDLPCDEQDDTYLFTQSQKVLS